MTAPVHLPLRLKLLLGAQLAVAVLFFFFFWSQTVSLARGRAASWQDLVGLAMPALLVLACATLALRLWRRGRRQAAVIAAILPFPLALVGFMAAGAV